MDAGLAAVLGAGVGALGTGGGAIVTGILGRAQARMQLRAEHVRVLREPRRAAYVAFAECFQRILTRHATASRFAAAAAETEGPQREEHLREAEGAYRQAGDRFHGDMQRLQSAVTVEGPPDVTQAVLRAGEELLADRGTLHRWIRLLASGTATEEHERDVDDAHLVANSALVRFLDAASSALAYDGLSER
ncbi:hypothetical protein [Streptomyces sp. GS7]|uniref:hypothetical protein n=1 Tax=Streptomyces sp. GS7 TaxID=2692234 RepID=UPI001319121D|nr:hypothetical protein [Streptomyces sp. GS7]QHC22814.1 hypothetical protein GR130_16625 [Streptomyces sp. GS7]